MYFDTLMNDSLSFNSGFENNLANEIISGGEVLSIWVEA